MHEDNQQNDSIRCAIYARSATKNPSAITRQIAHCKQSAHKRGWEIDDRYIFQDDGFGGSKTPGRPGLDRLLAAVENQSRPIDLLLVEEVSRLGRNLHRIVEIFGVLTAHGVSVYAAETKLELSGPTGVQLLENARGVRARGDEVGQQFKKVVTSKRENRQGGRY